jgi:hypothetical protein
VSITFDLPDVAPDQLFVLSRVFTTGEPISPTLSTGPLTLPSAPWPEEVQIITHDSNPQLGLITASEYISSYPTKSPILNIPINTPTVEPGLLLTKFLGSGASGSVCYADSGYAVKIATWKEGKDMVRHEAMLYEVLLTLQGLCIPKLFGHFHSEQLDVLILEFMSRSLKRVDELNIEQRWVVPSNYISTPSNFTENMTDSASLQSSPRYTKWESFTATFDPRT